MWSDIAAQQAAEHLTNALRTPRGTQQLWTRQAIALTELAHQKGAFIPVKVGGGKTLISLLAPRMVACRRPLLLVPASLKQKTIEARRVAAQHWRLHPNLRLESIEWLSNKNNAKFLLAYQPDMIIVDEAHYLKDRKSSRTSRMLQYMRAHPGTVFVAMSGTFLHQGVDDFAHISAWCLKDRSPVPTDYPNLMEWVGATSPERYGVVRMDAGALSQLQKTPTQPIREAIRDRIVETAGVIASQDTPIDAPLNISYTLVEIDLGSRESAWDRLRDEAVTPDGRECVEQLDVYRHARELGLGMFYTWWNVGRLRSAMQRFDPDMFARVGRHLRAEPSRILEVVVRTSGQLRTFADALTGSPAWDAFVRSVQREPPLAERYASMAQFALGPPEWLEARSSWASAARQLVKRFPGLDSIGMAKDWAHENQAAPEHKILQAWEAVRGDYEPVTYPVWLSSQAIDYCSAWSKRTDNSIIWVHHQHVGHALENAGIPYFGSGGYRANGEYLSTTNHARIAASISACKEGFHLVRYTNNLVTSPRASGAIWEQMLGRTHREGQTSAVNVEVLLTCGEDVAAFGRARARARLIQDIQGQPQKLMHANYGEQEFTQIVENLPQTSRWHISASEEELEGDTV